MPRITVSISDEQDDRLDELSGNEAPYPSKSAAVRASLNGDEVGSSRGEGVDETDEWPDERDELVDQIRNLEQENQRLNRERRQLLEQREENQELVEYVQEQRSLERRDRERDQEHESRSIFVRGWRYVFGRPTDDQ
jgi:Arc/MetJ-type ribon-helix-helix transcriptional regulator